MIRQRFASDNASPAHPAILQALQELPADHELSYGDDPVTRAAEEAITALFDRPCEVYFAYNGTGANVSALRCVARPWDAVICNEMAHINEDEGGAPEAIGGFKLLGTHRKDGKLSPADVEPFLARRGFEHTNQPAAVSVTQVTEVGTLYTPAELRELTDFAHSEGLRVHVDGARVANAAAAWYERRRAAGEPMTPEAAMRAVTSDAGIDVLSFGATKNGLLFGEAVVFFQPELAAPYRYARKQTTKLHSKMRYLSAQFLRYLSDDLWLDNARAANSGAARLSAALEAIPGVTVALPTEANGVFVEIPPEAVDALQREFDFYLWDRTRSMARLMVSWDTTALTIDAFIRRCTELCS
ncbi:MAG: beta-eliminating lyase-related protein [Spirochaeta sp.]|jgi:threonine aldolase|nr:beta-eliminating lyase-related protein [Spirochaeta sp.]